MVKFSSSLLILSISIVNAFSSTLQPTKRPDVLVPSKTLTSRFSSKYGNIRDDPPPTILGASIAASNEENYMDPKSNSSTEIERKRKQSLGSAIFNLVKANVGSGVFALPAGIAAFGDVPSILGPAIAVMCFLGALSAYAFYMIPRLTRLNGVDDNSPIKSISAAWEQEVGKDSAWLISLCCLLTPLGTALTFSIVMKDMLGTLAKSAGLTGFFASKHALLVGITVSVLHPLCNLKSLAALSPVSMIGVVGTIITCLYMVARALPTSPYLQAGSELLKSIPETYRPSFGIVGNNSLSPSILVLVSMAATSLLVHFSAHDFCNDLEDNSPERFKKLTGFGFSLTVLINIIIMSAGFLTFGGACQGMILNNYSSIDPGATLSRLIVAISLIGSFPILVRAIKSAFFELSHKGKQVTEKFEKNTTKTILGALTAIALAVDNAGVVVSLNGAVMGSFIIYAFPSIIFLKLTSRLMAEGKLQKSRKLSIERFFNRCLVGSGALIAFFGAMVIMLEQ